MGFIIHPLVPLKQKSHPFMGPSTPKFTPIYGSIYCNSSQGAADQGSLPQQQKGSDGILSSTNKFDGTKPDGASPKGKGSMGGVSRTKDLESSSSTAIVLSCVSVLLLYVSMVSRKRR